MLQNNKKTVPQIVGVAPRDAGLYQCQAATTTGTITLSTDLRVASPKVHMLLNRPTRNLS